MRDRRVGATNANFTVWHSTMPIAAFVEMLRGGKVGGVVDIRCVSRSSANPQYNRDVLPAALASCQIGYEGLPELGGLRKTSKSIPPDVNGFWTNRSFHNYADYALSAEFRTGLDCLLELAVSRRDRKSTRLNSSH